MNADSVYIDPSKEVMLTIKDFHECSYYDKSIQFCNYSLMVDTSNPRVIQLWTKEGDSHVLIDKIPFANKRYVSPSIEAEYVRIVNSPITLAWVKKHFGYAILKESEEELQKIWPELVDQNTRKKVKQFYNESKHYIDFDDLLEDREAAWEKDNVNGANKSFKKNVELIWNPDIMQDRLSDANFKGYYSKKEGLLNKYEYIYLIWDTGRGEGGFAEGFSRVGTSTGYHSFEYLDSYKELTREQFLEKFLEINEYSRLKEIEDEKRRIE